MIFLRRRVVWCVAPTLFLLFLCVHPQLTMSLWKEFLSFKASTTCCFLQPSRYKDWSKTPGIFLPRHFHFILSLWMHSAMRWIEGVLESHSGITACFLRLLLPRTSIKSAPSQPLTTTSFHFNITWDIHTPKQGHLTHCTILEAGICLWRASIVLWLQFGCTPEAVWVDWCERVQGERQTQGRWTTELTTLG